MLIKVKVKMLLCKLYLYVLNKKERYCLLTLFNIGLQHCKRQSNVEKSEILLDFRFLCCFRRSWLPPFPFSSTSSHSLFYVFLASMSCESCTKKERNSSNIWSIIIALRCSFSFVAFSQEWRKCSLLFSLSLRVSVLNFFSSFIYHFFPLLLLWSLHIVSVCITLFWGWEIDVKGTFFCCVGFWESLCFGCCIALEFIK